MPSKPLMWLHDPAHRKSLRTLQVAFVVLILAAIAGGAMLARAALESIFPPVVERQSEIRSPDSNWVAVTYRINRTGALGGYNYEVRLARSQDPTERGSLVWDSYMERPIGVRWLSRSTIEVEVASDSGGEAIIRERRSHGIAARTLVVQDGHLVPFHSGRP